jgi:hypothetical protein
MKVAIHQPNFFPWLGYFAKISASDKFVFLDDVDLSGGSSWVNRVKVLVANKDKWVTAPLDAQSRETRILNTVEFSSQKWKTDFWKTLEYNYKRSDYWSENSGLIESIVKNQQINLSEYNKYAVVEIAAVLGIDRDRFVSASSLKAEKKSTDRLIELVKRLSGDIYLSGDGASDYQEESLFRAANIELRLMNFTHPIYTQRNQDFFPGLSVLDALISVGRKSVSELLKIRSK